LPLRIVDARLELREGVRVAAFGLAAGGSQMRRKITDIPAYL
jgi:hypothetical protein